MDYFGIIVDFPALSGFLEEGKERRCCGLMVGWTMEKLGQKRQEMGGHHRPAATFLTWLTLRTVAEQNAPLQGLMTHSKDSPHPLFSICGDFNSPQIGSPRCHVCSNFPNSFQHSPQRSVWPQPPLRFAEDTFKAALWSSSNIKYLWYEVKLPEWESLTLNVVRIKVWDAPLSLPNCPTLMLTRASASTQPPSPSSFRLTAPPLPRPPALTWMEW